MKCAGINLRENIIATFDHRQPSLVYLPIFDCILQPDELRKMGLRSLRRILAHFVGVEHEGPVARLG